MGASCHSLTSVCRLMICQLTVVSKVEDIQRVRLARSRGRQFHMPSYRSLLNSTGCRPRARNNSEKEVSTRLPPTLPSLRMRLISTRAPCLYQSFLPKYLYPLASPTRSTP